MKIWRFSDPGDHRFARASLRGTWAGSPSTRVRPLILEWEPSTNVVGDFSWPGFDSEVVAKDEVRKEFSESPFKGFEFSEVQILNTGKDSQGNRKKQIPDCTNLKLFELWITSLGRLDLEHSTIRQSGTVSDGKNKYEVHGIERWETIWDKAEMKLIQRRQKRDPGKGLFFNEVSDIFRVIEFPRWIFCTDKVKDFIEGKKFSNVNFLEMGEILENSRR